MTTPSTPRKRQNLTSQSSITTFFTPTSSRSTAAPDVPTPIKSSLLTVGMRVRKSVPEGYKSGTYKFNAFTVTKSSDNINSAKPKSPVTLVVPGSPSKKREFTDEVVGGGGKENNAPVEMVRGDIAVPKSLRRRFHAAVARKDAAARQQQGDIVMGETGEQEEFEEAGFLVRGG
ncbi:hypothetical protein L873DRAFT_30698 [Choiromyces venosus 120613-1]|uniref:Uncharacterized protein n=1 Tax=Choiromyces venosus 120613-1 TaxID=1336337 RepID=A0A3N4KA60_9PEZI|nr:hypothetical protein L873DRAFT_30698 [Choiromyces venosus 120613-1]